MSDPDFQRARRPEQKEERRERLLVVARDLLARDPDPQSLSLNELAREAGMAKSNVYRYFESREAVLLELLSQDWGSCFEDARTRLMRASKRGRVTLERLVRIITESILRYPLLGPLSSVLPSIIEHNVSVDTVRSFKLSSMQLVQELARLCHACGPDLPIAAYEELAHFSFTLLIGLWPLSHPSQSVQQALQAPELAAFRHEFSRDFERGLLVFARGLLNTVP
ncbi:MAG: TetR family transcriptional regulator [Polyangiaceae bacterium]